MRHKLRDQIHIFERQLQESIGTGIEIRVRIYQEYEDRTIIGTVLQFDQEKQQIRIAGEWIAMADIVAIDSPVE